MVLILTLSVMFSNLQNKRKTIQYKGKFNFVGDARLPFWFYWLSWSLSMVNAESVSLIFLM